MKNIWFSYNFLSSVLIFLLISPHVFSQYDGKLGINLGGVHPYIWVDVVKSARAWEEPAGGPLKADEIDENGWPEADFKIVLMDHRPVMEWAGTIDDPEQY